MLLGNLTADGDTGWHPVGNEDLRSSNLFGGAGTFGGGTLTLSISFNDDKSDPMLVSASSLTADGAIEQALPGVKWARANLVGATAPNVNAYIGLGG